MRRTGNDVVDGALLFGPKIPWPEGWTEEQVIAGLEPFATEQRKTRLLQVIGSRVGSVTLLMDAPHDPHNGAAVVRTCDAFGLPELHIVPRAEPFLVGRSVTKGTERWVDLVLHPTAEQALTALSARGFTLVSTHPEGKLTPDELPRIPRLALVLGNERDGICRELLAAASGSVRVPMRGFVESLNVSVAAAILISAATRGRPGDLSAVERRKLYARGLFYSVPKAVEILAASAALDAQASR